MRKRITRIETLQPLSMDDFAHLPETDDEAFELKWNERPEVHVPSLTDGHASRVIRSQEEAAEYLTERTERFESVEAMEEWQAMYKDAVLSFYKD